MPKVIHRMVNTLFKWSPWSRPRELKEADARHKEIQMRLDALGIFVDMADWKDSTNEPKPDAHPQSD
jgi:hypothetical protein